MKVLQFIKDSCAAALAYSIGQDDPESDQTCLVLDFGGVSFEATVLSSFGGLYTSRGSIRDSSLGGRDIDAALLAHFANEFKRKHKADLLDSSRAKSKLLLASENVKKILSSSATADYSIDSLYEGIDFRVSLNRGMFNNLCGPTFERCLDVVKKLISQCGLSAANVDHVILAGGSARIPGLQSKLAELFGEKKLRQSVLADEVLAIGAATQAAVVLGRDHSYMEDAVKVRSCPRSIGFLAADGQPLTILHQHTPLPASRTRVFNVARTECETMVFRFYAGQEDPQSRRPLADVSFKVQAPADQESIPIELTVSVDEFGSTRLLLRNRLQPDQAPLEVMIHAN